MNIAEKILRAKADYDAVFEAGKKAVGEVLKFTDVASTAYRSIVPNGVEPFAKVNKIGGMSYKTRNLIPYYYTAGTTVKNNGVTFTVNNDGSITANGTATGSAVFYLIETPIANLVESGKTYTLSGCPSGGSTTTYELHFRDSSNRGNAWRDGGSGHTKASTTDETFTNKQIAFIRIENGTTVNNLVFRPMLNKGTTALPYEPYFEGLRSASVGELKSEGANIFDINAEPLDLYNTKITRLEDGLELKTAVAVTSTTTNLFYRSKLISIKGSKIYFSVNATPVGKVAKGLCRIWVKDENGNNISSAQKNGVGNLNVVIDVLKNLQNKGYIQILLYSSAGEICDAGDGVIYNEPMLTFDVDVPYKQYKGNIDTLTIPEPIKSLDGYGLGVNSEYYNYIDFERKVFVQNVYRKVFDGTEYISKGTNGAGVTRFIASTPYTAINVSNAVNVVCNHYKPSTIYETNDYAENRLGASASAIRWVDDELLNGTEEEMKAKLKAWYDEGNPLIVDYILAEPIETDISAYLTDEYIEVEGGGTITAVNEYGYDAPTNISYLIDTQGEPI